MKPVYAPVTAEFAGAENSIYLIRVDRWTGGAVLGKFANPEGSKELRWTPEIVSTQQGK